METIGIGTAGLGGFAMFALQHFLQVDGVRLVAISETHAEASFAAAQRFGIAPPTSFGEMLENPEVTLVYIATPPFLHFDQARRALEYGKHVICEKPLAMTEAQTRELAELARGRGLCLVANLMQRYNPYFVQVRELIRRNLLGEPLYARFENCACDEGLKPEHWFWDRSKSGGIFVEHGVHFFDLFEGWFGEGVILSAQRSLRPGSGVEEQVSCSGRFGSVDVHFLHSFTQANRMDRQEIRIVFERGDVLMEEWVPTRVIVRGLMDEPTTRELVELFPKSKLEMDRLFHPEELEVTGRFKTFRATQLVTLESGLDAVKMHVYGKLLRNMMADQKAWIANPQHERLVTDLNGVRSVALAEQADRLALAADQSI